MSLMQKINNRLCAVFVKQKHVSLKRLKSYILCDAVSVEAQCQTSKGVLIFEEEAFFPCKSYCKFLLLISGQDAYIRLLLQIGRDKLLLGRR